MVWVHRVMQIVSPAEPVGVGPTTHCAFQEGSKNSENTINSCNFKSNDNNNDHVVGTFSLVPTPLICILPLKQGPDPPCINSSPAAPLSGGCPLYQAVDR